MKAVFISDVHLTSPDEPVYSRLIQFVDMVRSQKFDLLFIVGDLFEILTGSTDYVRKRFSGLFEKFGEYTNSGGRIYYLYGNHDFNFKLAGITVAEQFAELMIGKFKCYISHGDGLDPLDHRYRFLKNIIRSTLFKLVSRFIPGRIVYVLGSFFSFISRNANRRSPIKRKRYLVYRDFAINKLNTSDLDVCIMAHTHVAELISINTQLSVKYYMNTGSFSMSNSYGMIDDNGIYLLTL